VNPPEERPSVSAAPSHRRSAQPTSTPMMARITSYPELDISVPFDWNATAAEVTERVRAAMED
jgi:hypothetical protein